MEILRQSPYPLTITIWDGHPDQYYDVLLVNGNYEWGTVVMSSPTGKITVEVPNDPFAMYDETYTLTASLDNQGPVPQNWFDAHTEFIDEVTFVKPLWEVDLSDPDDVMKERLVRNLINSITGGFAYSREWLEGQGLGTDFFPTPARTYDVLQGYENNVHVFDHYLEGNVYDYVMTKDITAITIPYSPRKSVASKQVKYKNARSDSFGQLNWHWKRPFFPKDFYYHFLIARGYPVIPSDIKDVAQILKDNVDPDNIGGGSPEMSGYISEYSTDQFKLKFAPGAYDVSMTGNKFVDSILSKYVARAREIDRLGVL